jgi:hypothetical protein
VEKILDLVTEEDESSRPWFWLTMPERESGEKLSELTDWVETVLRVQYPATSPTRSGPAGRITRRPGGSCPGYGPPPTSGHDQD